jgi:hypothetical protein
MGEKNQDSYKKNTQRRNSEQLLFFFIKEQRSRLAKRWSVRKIKTGNAHKPPGQGTRKASKKEAGNAHKPPGQGTRKASKKKQATRTSHPVKEPGRLYKRSEG